VASLTNIKKTFIENKLDERYYHIYYDFEPGNCLLIELRNGNYVFVGNAIYEFKLKSNVKIVNFKSPVGGNAVPYPFAIDNKGTYYLLMEDEIVHLKEKIPPNNVNNIIEPYRFYYNQESQENQFEKIKITKQIYHPTYIRF
jgi:hypothetical protein